MAIYNKSGADIARTTDGVVVTKFAHGLRDVRHADIVEVEDLARPSKAVTRALADAATFADSVAAVAIATLTPVSVRALSAGRIRVLFPERVRSDTPGTTSATYALTEPASYQINPLSTGAADVFVLSVSIPVGQSNPNNIDLKVTEMTEGADYELVIVGKLLSVNDEPSGTAPTGFQGKGDAPRILLVVATGRNTVEVRFSEAIRDNAAARDVNNYRFDNGLVATEVVAVLGNVVVLKTTTQASGQLYNMGVHGTLYVSVGDGVGLAESLNPNFIRDNYTDDDDEIYTDDDGQPYYR